MSFASRHSAISQKNIISGKIMNYDAIIIGAGHNGLVTAAFLAKSGKKVLVLERRDVLGGATATEEIFPGFKFNTGAHDAGLFLPEIVKKLDLQQYGLEFIESPAAACALQPDGPALTLWQDIKKSQEEIARFSKTDAVKFPQFCQHLEQMTKVLADIRTSTPPHVKGGDVSGLLPWLKSGLQLKRLGKQDMMAFMRALPMSVRRFLDEWFENEILKGVIGASGVTGSMQGPMAEGTTFTMLNNTIGASGGFKASKFVRGGMGQLSEALAKAAKQHGAEIRTGVEVKQIVINEYKTKSILLANGDELSARAIISNADPRRTFFDLVGAPNLGPQFNRMVNNIRFRGTTAKMNLALSSLPTFKGVSNPESQLSGHIIICPNLEYLERAYDDAKYGIFAKQPYLDIVIPTVLDSSLAPEGQHVMSITMQYAPYRLQSGDWDEQREKLAETIIKTISKHAPDFKNLILHQHLLVPLDLERDYGLTEGSIYHGQMGLDQLLFMRPVPGWGRYRTPGENLYLCGAGTHPGGGVTGAPGYNAAREVLKDLK